MHAVTSPRAVWASAGAVVLALGLLSSTPPALHAQAGTQGQWRTLTNQAPINPIHVALMNNGEVLIVAGSGNVATETLFQAAVWDPIVADVSDADASPGTCSATAWSSCTTDGCSSTAATCSTTRSSVSRAMRCSTPQTHAFTNVQNMAHGRWYPTVTTLGDGRVMTFSGLLETGGTNSAVEIYTVGSGWSPEFPAGWTPPLYPRMHLSTDGRVFYAGSGRGSRFFNPANEYVDGRRRQHQSSPVREAMARRSCCH